MISNDNTEGTNSRPVGGVRSDKISSEHAICREGILTKYQFTIFYVVCSPFFAGLFFYLGYRRSEWFLYLVGMGFLAAGIAAVIFILKNMYRGVRRVLLTETGIQWEDEEAVHDKTWEDVREVYKKDILKRGDRLTDLRVVFTDGSRMTVDNRLKKYNSLCESLVALSTRTLLERKRREFTAGKADFGPVAVHRDGMEAKDQKKKWEELEQWTVNNGYLYIISTDPQDRYGWEVSLFDIPNYSILFQLLTEVWQPHTPPAASIPFGGGRRTSAK